MPLNTGMSRIFLGNLHISDSKSRDYPRTPEVEVSAAFAFPILLKYAFWLSSSLGVFANCVHDLSLTDSPLFQSAVAQVFTVESIGSAALHSVMFCSLCVCDSFTKGMSSIVPLTPISSAFS
jgi:hypothetical protein